MGSNSEMNQALHCNLPKANCNSPTFSQPSLETKIFVSFCNLLQQLASRLSISCLSTTKYWVFKKIINSKEEDRTKQELFSSTRSGAVYLLHTKHQSHWFEWASEYKKQDRNEQMTQDKTRNINQKKVKYQQAKKDTRQEFEEERVNCVKNEK